MKKTVSLIAALITGIFLSSATAAPPKATGFIAAKQLQTITAGQTQEEVIKAFGKPQGQPKWKNGTHSLVYKTDAEGSRNSLVYIDIDAAGKVIKYVVRPDGSPDSGGDSGSSDGGGGAPN